MSKGKIDKFSDCVAFPSANYIIFRLILLEHEPHGLHIIPGISPVAFCIEVAQEELILQAKFDSCQGSRDLPGDECLATTW